ncbi:MAG: MFS transporter [Chloroflexi bacterium]|nr:MFS transporter [Chloroflexota bacterium]
MTHCESPITETWFARLPFNYGWVIAAVGALGIFMSGPGQTYIVSLFIDPIIEETGWSRTLVSGLYSAGSISAALGALLAGRAFDRFGARVTLTGVVASFGLAVFMMARISNPVHLFFGFFAIRSLGQTAMTLVSTSMVGVWFVRLRGRATSATMLAGPLSQAVLPPIVYLIIAADDWRGAWQVLGIAVWVIMVPPALLLVRRSPESVGLLPDGDRRRAVPTLTSFVPEESWTVSEAVRTPAFWLLTFAAVPASLISTALTFHHISVMRSNGIEENVAAGILSVMAVAALTSTAIAGYLVDRFPIRFVLLAGQALIVLAMMFVLVLSATWHGFIYGALLGMAQGLVSTSQIVIWPNYFGRRYIGNIRGVATTGMVVAAGLGPLPFSILFEATKSYDAAVLGLVALPVIGGVAALAAAPPTKRAPGLLVSPDSAPRD